MVHIADIRTYKNCLDELERDVESAIRNNEAQEPCEIRASVMDKVYNWLEIYHATVEIS